MTTRAAKGVAGGLLQALPRLVLLTFTTIGLFTTLVLATPLDAWWAHAYAGSIEQPHGDILILLAAANDDDGYISYSSYWRARYALLAWSSGTFRTLVVSGGGPALLHFLVAEGIPRDRILADECSTTTRENGIQTARLVSGLEGRKVLLTSDFHMFRARRVFRRLGVAVEPAPVPDVLKLSQHWYGRLAAFQTLAVESAKIFAYELHGWI